MKINGTHYRLIHRYSFKTAIWKQVLSCNPLLTKAEKPIPGHHLDLKNRELPPCFFCTHINFSLPPSFAPHYYRNIAMNMKQLIFLLTLPAMVSCGDPDAEQKESQTEISANTMNLHSALQSYADSLPFEFEQIPPERREALQELAAFIQAQKDSGRTARLNFICTHNSRRSHLGQIWAAAAAAYYGVEDVETFSGGTEATAFNPRAVGALERAGFVIDKPEGANPRYRVHLRAGDAGLVCFSKKYDDAANPAQDFAAIMTCSQADAECPFIPGAAYRLSLPYNDPKEADGTPEESARYDERCRQIGREMMFAFSLL
jgi:hypothetical protein